MRISRGISPHKEKTIVKRILLIIATAVLFINTFVAPVTVRAEGVGGTSCGGGACKP
jgi:hypothetical protein